MTWEQMMDQLMDEDPVIQKKMAKAEEKGSQATAVSIALLLVQNRFPALADLTKQRLSEMSRVEPITAFLIQFNKVQDEGSARRLLENLNR